jgi:Flp pilus assembly protein TadG
LLKPAGEHGSAPLEAIFAIVFLLLLVLGTLQVALALYARNVVASAAHEGARAAVELGRDPASAERVAREIVRRSAGGLVDELVVVSGVEHTDNSDTVRVVVRGSLAPFGPVPVSIPFVTTARASRSSDLP